MKKQQVWSKSLNSLMPLKCTCLKNKLTFMIKPNDVYQTILMACGYSQVPAINFSKNYHPL